MGFQVVSGPVVVAVAARLARPHSVLRMLRLQVMLLMPCWRSGPGELAMHGCQWCSL